MLDKKNSLTNLIDLFSKLPSLGPKTAKRIVLQLISHDKNKMSHLAHGLLKTLEEVKTCSLCCNVDVQDPCQICSSSSREKSTICVVENIGDLWTMERSGTFNGFYHVLGGNLSVLNEQKFENLNLGLLVKRIEKDDVTEIILANNSNANGQTTAYFIADFIKESCPTRHIKITTLGNGVPIGSEIDYLDDGTIAAAINSRREM